MTENQDQNPEIKYLNTVLNLVSFINKLKKSDQKGKITIQLEDMKDPMILNFNSDNKYIYNHLINLFSDFKHIINYNFESTLLEKYEKEEKEKIKSIITKPKVIKKKNKLI